MCEIRIECNIDENLNWKDQNNEVLNFREVRIKSRPEAGRFLYIFVAIVWAIVWLGVGGRKVNRIIGAAKKRQKWEFFFIYLQVIIIYNL